jgi:hypothetical protein
LQLEAYQEEQIYEDAKGLIQDAVDKMSTGLSIEDTDLGELLLNQKFASDNERATMIMEISELIGLVMGGIKPAEENQGGLISGEQIANRVEELTGTGDKEGETPSE